MEVVIWTGVTEVVTVKLRFAVALCAVELESVTFTVNEEVPAVVGVPLICPVALSANPAGKAPALIDQLYGVVPPLACSVVEYPLPTAAPGSEPVMTFGSEVTCRVAVAVITLPTELLTATRKLSPLSDDVAGGVV